MLIIITKITRPYIYSEVFTLPDSEVSACIKGINPFSNCIRQVYYFSHFIDEEPEAQRGYINC